MRILQQSGDSFVLPKHKIFIWQTGILITFFLLKFPFIVEGVDGIWTGYGIWIDLSEEVTYLPIPCLFFLAAPVLHAINHSILIPVKLKNRRFLLFGILEVIFFILIPILVWKQVHENTIHPMTIPKEAGRLPVLVLSHLVVSIMEAN